MTWRTAAGGPDDSPSAALRSASRWPSPARRGFVAALAAWLFVSVGSAGAQDLASVDPCALLTDDEVAATYGTIGRGGAEDELPTTDLRQCSWLTRGGDDVFFGGLFLQLTAVRDVSVEALLARLGGDPYLPLDAQPIAAGPVVAAYATDPDAATPTVVLVAAIVGGLQVTLVPGEWPEAASPAFAGLLDLLWTAVARLAD